MNALALGELHHPAFREIHAIDLPGSRPLGGEQDERIVPGDEAMMVVRQMVQYGRICQSKELSLSECVPQRRNLGGDSESPARPPTGPQQGRRRTTQKRPPAQPPHRNSHRSIGRCPNPPMADALMSCSPDGTHRIVGADRRVPPIFSVRGTIGLRTERDAFPHG